MKTYQVTVSDNGMIQWRFEGKLHREDGPAKEYANGGKSWYLNGERHREDGPAIEYAYGGKSWYLNGKLHREDGPAIEDSDGNKYWYLNGVELTEQEHTQKTRAKKTCLMIEGKEIEISGETLNNIKKVLGV